MIEWPQEEIPGQDTLFMRVHKMWQRSDGSVGKAAFRNHNGGMSTDWDKFSTPEQTRLRAKVPEENAVVSMIVGSVQEVPGQQVEHTPDVERRNRAHTDVFGEKDEEVRVKLRRLAEIVMPFDVPGSESL